MSTMNMPGFTAEASLYMLGRTYCGGVRASKIGAPAAVVAQQAPRLHNLMFGLGRMQNDVRQLAARIKQLPVLDRLPRANDQLPSKQRLLPRPIFPAASRRL